MLCTAVTVGAITRSELVSFASSLNGKKKSELKTAVFNLIGSPYTLKYGSGTKCTWWGFYYTDRDNETNECINRYSDDKFYFSSSNTGSAIGGMNIEHSFPKSWWGGEKSDKGYCDLYNLYPSDDDANSYKSNYPMCVVEDVDKSKSSDKYDKVGKSTINGQYVWCWEPGDQYKGDFARSYMYMATCYQDYTWEGTGLQSLENNTWPTLKQWAYTLYLEWLKSDPVDQMEVERNNAVADIQVTRNSNGTITKRSRNLFIDFPYLAEYIWGDSIDVPFNPATSITTADDDLRYTGAPVVAVAKPQISPDGGTFDEAQTVTITTSSESAVIRYTTDGSSPTNGGTVYSGPITISTNTTLKAVAIDGEGHVSSIASATFVIVIDDGGDPVTDFAETFANCNGTGGNDGNFGGAASKFVADYDGWQAVAAYGGDGCARFGSSSKSGVVSTPMFNISGTTTFSFRAAPFGTDGTSLKLSASEGVTLSQTELTMTQGQWTNYTVSVTGEGPVIITFTPAKRFFLDDVVLGNVLPPTPPPTPTEVFGDLNGDGEVDAADLTILINIILGKE